MPSEVTSPVLAAAHVFAEAVHDYTWSSHDLDHELAAGCFDAGDYGDRVAYAAGHDLATEEIRAFVCSKVLPDANGLVYAVGVSGENDIALVGDGTTRVLDPADTDDKRLLDSLLIVGC